MRPLVTVITPAYNCERFIEETIESVLNQDYENKEYVVIDDCSDDDTYKKIREYSNRLVFIHSKVNEGEQKTVNYALEHHVRGKYFMIVNADDPLWPFALSTLVEFMQDNPDVLVGYPDWTTLAEDGSVRREVKTIEYDYTYMVKHHTCLPSVGSIFRSTVIDKVGYRDTGFQWLGDFDYWLRIGLVGDMARVPIKLATWRHRYGQASSRRSDERAMEHIKVIRKLYKAPMSVLFTPRNLDDPMFRLHFGFTLDKIKPVEKEATCWSYIVAATVAHSKRLVFSYLLKAFRCYPRLLASVEFWHALANRAWYILTR